MHNKTPVNLLVIPFKVVALNWGHASSGGRTQTFKGVRVLMCFATHSLLILRLTFSRLLYRPQCLTLERRKCRNRHDPYFSVVTAPFVFEGTL